MILSIGLSPAWQQILVFDAVRVDGVNRARIAEWRASGKVFNAGIAIHTLGGPGLVIAPVGGAAKGPMEEEFRALGMDCRCIQTRSATRVCTTVIDKATGAITELVEEGRPMEADELQSFRAACVQAARRAKAIVMTGSLPSGVPVSFYRELLGELLQEQHCPMVLDFRGEGLLSVLDLRPLIVKPNREELEKTVGYSLDNAPDDDQALVGAMRSLNRRGAEWVVVTQGAAPVWISSATALYRMTPAPMEAHEIINPIGSGDAMAGAMAWAIGNRAMEDGETGNQGTADEKTILEAIRLGVAAAAQNVRGLLPCRLDASTLADEARKTRIERLE